MKETLKKHIVNARGRRLNKKFIVFESDDWGAIRIPNKQTRDELYEKGLTRRTDPFSRLDTLETSEDYQALFEVLFAHKDRNGNHPLLTANFILNNPDFEKISNKNFEEYHRESFRQTYERLPYDKNGWQLLSEGIKNKLIVPQFHGSEHLNVIRWMDYLKSGDPRYHFAFQRNCFAIDEIGEHNRRQNLMAAYDHNNEKELAFVEKSIAHGLDQFEKMFGFKSMTSIAPCYVWDTHVEKAMLNGGVQGLQGSFLQNCPIPEKSFKKKYRYNGEENEDKQLYFVRNGLFEPSANANVDWVTKCIESIAIAFKWGKPAIISSHRINFVGTLDRHQRDQNLQYLNDILKIAIKKWPDVQFTNSANLLQEYHKH